MHFDARKCIEMYKMQTDAWKCMEGGSRMDQLRVGCIEMHPNALIYIEMHENEF